MRAVRRKESVGQELMEFAAFYEGAKDGCLRAVMVTVGDADLAEDLVAESFARALASWSKVARHPNPAAWVVRVALNVHVSWWRRRRTESSGFDWREHDPPGRQDAGESVVDAQIMAVLKLLPERQRQVIALRLFLDLDTETTARTLGIATGTVTAHLARATRVLRDHLVSAMKEGASP